MTKITELALRTLPPNARLTDDAIEGFVARCLPSGRISFGYQYTDKATGKRKWMGIGLHGNVTADEARNQAKRFAGQVAARRDPAAELKVKVARSTNTVDHVLDQWLALHVKDCRGEVAIKQCLANHVRPAIGGRVIYDLERGELMRLVDELGSKFPRMAQVVLAHLRSAFNWWQLRDEKFKTPIVRGMVKDKQVKRARVLNAQELADLWAALEVIEHVPECFAPFVKVLLLTACRRNEVAQMHTSELDGDTWTIPATRYKTNVEHVVPLIAEIRKFLPKTFGFIFSTDNGKTPLAGFGKPKLELDRVIAEIRRRERRGAMPAWTFHDLRRTARTLMAELKIERDTAEACLGHVIGGVEGVYNRYKYIAEKTDALSKLAAHVERLVKPRPPAPAAKLRLVAG
jgi:integrase